MKKYNYLAAVKECVKGYAENEIELSEYSNKQNLIGFLEKKLANNDNITGNASGSYTYSQYDAEENLCHNFDLLIEAIKALYANDIILKGAEACDVLIRMYLLPKAIEEVVNEIYK